MSECDPYVEQALYVEALFTNWAEHRDAISGITWWSLYDYSVEECAFVWGGPASPWCSMGLFDRDQSPKPAWSAFADSAAAVGSW